MRISRVPYFTFAYIGLVAHSSPVFASLTPLSLLAPLTLSLRRRRVAYLPWPASPPRPPPSRVAAAFLLQESLLAQHRRLSPRKNPGQRLHFYALGLRGTMAPARRGDGARSLFVDLPVYEGAENLEPDQLLDPQRREGRVRARRHRPVRAALPQPRDARDQCGRRGLPRAPLPQATMLRRGSMHIWSPGLRRYGSGAEKSTITAIWACLARVGAVPCLAGGEEQNQSTWEQGSGRRVLTPRYRAVPEEIWAT